MPRTAQTDKPTRQTTGERPSIDHEDDAGNVGVLIVSPTEPRPATGLMWLDQSAGKSVVRGEIDRAIIRSAIGL